jgi:hypothetical protein
VRFFKVGSEQRISRVNAARLVMPTLAIPDELPRKKTLKGNPFGDYFVNEHLENKLRNWLRHS